MRIQNFLLLASLGAAALPASVSLHYQTSPEAVGALGGFSTSAAYANVGAAGGIGGISTGPGPTTVRSGYIGQLFETVGLVLNAALTTINEGGVLQLGGGLLYDDATTNALPPEAIVWSVNAGPLTSVDPSGLASAALVYQDTPATVRGQFNTFFGTINLSVRNTHNDNFGSYAGDGLDDAWQAQYFGLDNPLAAPTADPNGTGQNNRFKFLAGLDPTLPASHPEARFVLTAQPVPGQPAQKQLSFHPVVAGRNYKVQFHSTLASPGLTWTDLTGFTQLPDNGNTRAVIDNGATDSRRFYRVEITKTPTPPGPLRP